MPTTAPASPRGAGDAVDAAGGSRVVLVTGAASGIGLAIAIRFLRDGWNTVLADRDPNVAAIAADLARESRGRAYAAVVDLADEAQAVALVGDVVARHGRLDALVNNAGIHPKKDGGKVMIEATPSAQWQEVMAINLTAPFLLCREALPAMRRGGWGRIVNISSRGGRTASPVASAPYAASKAGLIGFTRILALEAAGANITANCVTPGPIETGMTAQSSAEVRAAFARSVPLGRYGVPAEIAAAVAFLASDEASFVTGAVIDVNGGTFMP